MKTTSRDSWAAFVRERGPRFLGSVGSVVEWEAAAIDLDERSTLAILADKQTDHQLIAALHLLMAPATSDFVLGGGLAGLVRAIAATSSTDLFVTRNPSCGRVVWCQTLVQRRTGLLDAGQYRIAQRLRSFDTPENQLLKFYLESLVRLTTWLAKTVGTLSVPETIHKIHDRCVEVLREPYLRDITAVPAPTALMRRCARRHRARGYSTMLSLADELHAALHVGKWEAIYRLVSAGWLSPIGDDDLFELYSLLFVLDVLSADLGFQLTGAGAALSVLRRGGRGAATLIRGDDHIEVFFDQSPSTTLGVKSEYNALLAEYDGLPGSGAPRPDITMRITGRSQTVLFVEVKDTEDDRYMRSSVYKAMAYAQDYSSLWASEDLGPRVILLFPTEIAPRSIVHDRRDVVVSGGADRAWMAHLLSLALQRGEVEYHPAPVA